MCVASTTYHLPRGWLARWLAVGGCASLAPLLVARIACIILHPTRQTACHHARSGARLGSERQDEDRQTDSHAPPGWLGRIITCIAQHQCPVSTRQSKRKQRTTNQPDDRHRRSLQTHHHKSWIAASLVRTRQGEQAACFSSTTASHHLAILYLMYPS